MRARIRDIRRIRVRLGLSRAELAVFFDVPEATVGRWESDDAGTEPQGFRALLLNALAEAALLHPEAVAHIIRSCGANRRLAVEALRATIG